jgi:hypothetical protein
MANSNNVLIIIIIIIIIQFNSIYLCAKLNSPEANCKVSPGKKMGRVIIIVIIIIIGQNTLLI